MREAQEKLHRLQQLLSLVERTPSLAASLLLDDQSECSNPPRVGGATKGQGSLAVALTNRGGDSEEEEERYKTDLRRQEAELEALKAERRKLLAMQVRL